MHPMDKRKNIVSHGRSLKALLCGVEYKLSTGSPVDSIKEISIDSVTCDSRNVLTGTLFVAIKSRQFVTPFQ